VLGTLYVENALLESEIPGANMRNYLLALRRRLDYFDLLAVAAILLGIAIIHRNH
jgi:hypothetical protein